MFVPLAPPPPAANVLVFADEWRLNPSRELVVGRRVRFQLKNIGEDDHDLTIRRRAANASPLATTGIVRPGKLVPLSASLAPGRYILFCSIGDHEAQGMRRPFAVGVARR